MIVDSESNISIKILSYNALMLYIINLREILLQRFSLRIYYILNQIIPNKTQFQHEDKSFTLLECNFNSIWLKIASRI